MCVKNIKATTAAERLCRSQSGDTARTRYRAHSIPRALVTARTRCHAYPLDTAAHSDVARRYIELLFSWRMSPTFVVLKTN